MRPTTIQGIQFFDQASSCISHFEKAHWTQKALSLIKSFGALFLYFLTVSPCFRKKAKSPIVLGTQPVAGHFSKQRLIVCLHGLNNHPGQFQEIIQEIQKRNPHETDIYIPHIYQQGNAKLDDLVKPIFEEISKWAQNEGEKELVLIGISNGGRISRAIEAELIKSNNHDNIKKFKLVSIVGACKGSSLANLANRLNLSLILSKPILEEMPTNSNRNAQLNQDLANAWANLPEMRRDYTFIASPHDWQVPNYNSTLMEIPNQQARYAIITGHGHNSIVDVSAKAVAEIVLHSPKLSSDS